ncbi:hypothetical protein K439DRAFT_1658855 [Ramaria rubella]|nr:hypothetical protein K439DRAFT_1658855 [Ramaria rubella]
MSHQRSLQEILEAEYPLLDTSLLAALISDFPSPTDASDNSLEELRKTLSQLSLEAEAQQEQADSNVRAPTSRENGREASACPESDDVCGSENGGSSPDNLSISGSGVHTSISSATSFPSTTSPLEFLQILFPHISLTTIQKAWDERNALDDELIYPLDRVQDEMERDLSGVVDDLLTLEYLQDLNERGLEPISDTDSDSDVWQKATAGGNHPPRRPKPPKRSHTYKVPLVDTLQRQHVLRESVNKSTVSLSHSFSDDPWVRLTSLATRLSDLLPDTTSGFFMSYFHAPGSRATTAKTGWKGEGDAVRSALSDIVTRCPALLNEVELNGRINAVREIVLSTNTDDFMQLDAEQKSQLNRDIRLCVAATRGESAASLDLVWLLRDLDEAFDQGTGIAHALVATEATSLGTPQSHTETAWAAESTRGIKSPFITLPTQPPPAPPPPLSQKHPPPTFSSKKNREWTLVEPRRPAPDKYIHPHAEFIPAYSNRRGTMNRRPVKGPGNQFGKGGKGDVGELGRSAKWYQERAGDLQSQRNEALREASRHWQNRNAKTRGGEVAFYYAQKARELQEQQKEWALGAARMMVQEKRSKSNEYNVLDLHGLTISEACIIVKEALSASPPCPAQPLRIITGRGQHSVGQVGVLGPAVKDMLRGEGFQVGKMDGGLIVRGKR